MHFVMTLQSCGNLAFRSDFLANRWKSMCPRSENLEVMGQIWVLFVLLEVACLAWRCLPLLALLGFSGVACLALHCLALLRVACLAWLLLVALVRSRL